MFGNRGEVEGAGGGIPQDVALLLLYPWSLSKQQQQPALLRVTLWLPKLLISNLFPSISSRISKAGEDLSDQ